MKVKLLSVNFVVSLPILRIWGTQERDVEYETVLNLKRTKFPRFWKGVQYASFFAHSCPLSLTCS